MEKVQFFWQNLNGILMIIFIDTFVTFYLFETVCLEKLIWPILNNEENSTLISLNSYIEQLSQYVGQFLIFNFLDMATLFGFSTDSICWRTNSQESCGRVIFVKLKSLYFST